MHTTTVSPQSQHSLLVIGCGSIGERHLRCFQKTGRARVAACDTHPELVRKIGTDYAVEIFSDWQAALARRFDGVVICTPAPFHVAMGTAALEAGSHVLIEKPLSQSLQGIDGLLAARDRVKRTAAVAYTLQSYPILAAAREFLASQPFGPIKQALVTAGQNFPFYRPAYASTYYRDRKMGGGAIQDALTHSVNWVESVIGPTDSVICDCAHQVIPDVEVEDTVHISARSESGALVSYALNQFQSPNENTITFNAARGSVRVEFHHKRWGLWREGDTDWTWQETPVPDQDTHFTAQANAFLDKVEGRPSPLCSLEAAAQTLRFNLAALASARLGTRIHCRDIHA